MRHLTVLAMMACVGAASAVTLWDQSQLVNMPGAGTGTIAGQNLSMLETGESTFGFGIQSATPNIIADDFTLTQGATITGFSVFAYTTGATSPNVTGLNFAIGAAPTTSLGAASSFTDTFWTTGGANVYRVNVGDTGSTGGLREVQILTVTGLNISLSAGTYFLSFDATPGSFSPPLPTSLATHGQNEQQSTAGGAFAPVLQGSTGADMAFIITGNPVPEPASMLVVGGGIALIARRRRARKS